jgi:hypothetical protein
MKISLFAYMYCTLDDFKTGLANLDIFFDIFLGIFLRVLEWKILVYFTYVHF